MLKKFFLYFLFLTVTCGAAKATAVVNTKEFFNILQVKGKNAREKQLISYLRKTFQEVPANDVDKTKAQIINLLNKNYPESADAFGCFVVSLYQGKLLQEVESKKALVAAIYAAEKRKDDFLSCNFLNFLAFKQTEEGNVIGAVSSYRMAKKDAIKLHDTNLQMIIDINISDVYYKNDFYSQSLFYLDQAEALRNEFWPGDQRIQNIIYYNKAENFFRMRNADSLKVYNQKLKASNAHTYKLYTYKNRTDYYLFMLHNDYKKAIGLIHAMQHDEGYKFGDEDMQCLSEAFYKDGQLDSAKLLVSQLLAKPSEVNHPEVKYHLYDVLGKIAEQQNDYKLAASYFELSLQQSEDNMSRLTQVDNISSLIKVDEIEGYYSQKNQTYQRERLWLIFAVIFAFLATLVVAMFYRTIKQKRHYEKLLFETKKRELAFLNSHDVRKHLTNILGLVDVIKQSDNREKEFVQAEDHLFHSACQLDKAIQNISEKLDN